MHTLHKKLLVYFDYIKLHAPHFLLAYIQYVSKVIYALLTYCL